MWPCHRQMWLKSQDPRFLSCSSLPDKPLTCGSALLEQSLQLKTMAWSDSEAESSSVDDAWTKLQKTLIANRAAAIVAAKPATCGAGCTTKSETQSARLWAAATAGASPPAQGPAGEPKRQRVEAASVRPVARPLSRSAPGLAPALVPQMTAQAAAQRLPGWANLYGDRVGLWLSRVATPLQRIRLQRGAQVRPLIVGSICILGTSIVLGRGWSLGGQMLVFGGGGQRLAVRGAVRTRFRTVPNTIPNTVTNSSKHGAKQFRTRTWVRLGYAVSNNSVGVGRTRFRTVPAYTRFRTVPKTVANNSKHGPRFRILPNMVPNSSERGSG